jgi:hypothetical protein
MQGGRNMTVRAVAVMGTTLVGLMVSVAGVGCSAAPEGATAGNEAIDSTSQAICKDPPCVVLTPPKRGINWPPVVIIDPPPPADSCSFDGVARAMALGGYYKDPGGWGHAPMSAPATPPSPYHVMAQTSLGCVSGSASDDLSNLDRDLIADGCSAPVFWEAYNANGGPTGCDDSSPWSCWDDKANGIFLLCTFPNAAVDAKVAAGLQVSYGGVKSDMAVHWADTGKNAYGGPVPTAPSGYQWVSAWQDPHGCGFGGCMCDI